MGKGIQGLMAWASSSIGKNWIIRHGDVVLCLSGQGDLSCVLCI